MELNLPEIGWGGFIYYLVVLALVYLLLWLVPLPIRWLTEKGIQRRRWTNLARQVRTAYEPIALVLVAIALVFVHPVIHGLIVAGLVILGWGAIRNYVDGQLLRLTTPLQTGQEISLNGELGTVQEMYPLSLVLQTEAGSRIVPYRNLRDGGFTISRGARISGWQIFHLKPSTDSAAKQVYLRDRLFNCPYLSWSHQPEIQVVDGPEPGFILRLLLEDEGYQEDLRQLIGEWGYLIEEKP